MEVLDRRLIYGYNIMVRSSGPNETVPYHKVVSKKLIQNDLKSDWIFLNNTQVSGQSSVDRKTPNSDVMTQDINPTQLGDAFVLKLRVPSVSFNSTLADLVIRYDASSAQNKPWGILEPSMFKVDVSVNPTEVCNIIGDVLVGDTFLQGHDLKFMCRAALKVLLPKKPFTIDIKVWNPFQYDSANQALSVVSVIMLYLGAKYLLPIPGPDYDLMVQDEDLDSYAIESLSDDSV